MRTHLASAMLGIHESGSSFDELSTIIEERFGKEIEVSYYHAYYLVDVHAAKARDTATRVRV